MIEAEALLPKPQLHVQRRRLFLNDLNAQNELHALKELAMIILTDLFPPKNLKVAGDVVNVSQSQKPPREVTAQKRKIETAVGGGATRILRVRKLKMDDDRPAECVRLCKMTCKLHACCNMCVLCHRVSLLLLNASSTAGSRRCSSTPAISGEGREGPRNARARDQDDDA